jgi:lipooligosaccharide transport system permease protein
MFLFSGIFFPFNRLPDWVEVAAWFTPLFHLVEVTRGLANGPETIVLVHLGILLAISVVLFAIPVRAVRRRLVA